MDELAYQLSTYDYPLDKESIAQFPEVHRDQSRLAIIQRKSDSVQGGKNPLINHGLFQDLPLHLNRGDLLVLNDTRVFPARLIAKKDKTGGRIEVLLLKKLKRSSDPLIWEALIQGSVKPNQELHVQEEIVITIRERMQGGQWTVEVQSRGPLFEVLDRVGLTPLPPYIRRDVQESDRLRYQTVYARSPESLKEMEGSVAAPTAGLHFSELLLEKIRSRGVGICFVTVHIGMGTFLPVRSSDIRQHRMHAEYYEIPERTAVMIAGTRSQGGRIVAVGTSATRALETAAGRGEELGSRGFTDLFIFPGYRFKVVEILITNFHFPKSTLFMLVSAFASVHLMKDAYQEARRLGYRFMSFGDAMMIR